MSRGFALFLIALGIVISLMGTIGVLAVALGRGKLDLPMLITFVVIDSIGILMVVWAIRIFRRTKPIGEVPTVVGGRVGEYLADVEESHELDGTVYTVLYQKPIKGKHGRPSSLTVSTAVECTGEFHITGETWFDKMCKNFGLAVEIQTGDEQFDEICYVRSDLVAFTDAYLKDPIKRVAIVDMRRLGFPEVMMKDGEVSAKWTGFDPTSDDKPELAADAGARIVLLSRNLPTPQPEFEYRTGQLRKMWQKVLWGFLIVFGLSILSLIAYSPIQTSDLLLRAGMPLVIGAPVFAFLAAMLLRGTSTSHNAWGGLMIGALFLFPVGSVGTTALLNGVLDTSQPAVHDAIIVEKYTTKSKNSANYHVKCESWRDPNETISFGVSFQDYNRVTERRSKLQVTSRDGWLGVEWLVSKQVLP